MLYFICNVLAAKAENTAANLKQLTNFEWLILETISNIIN